MGHFLVPEMFSQICIKRCFNGKLGQHAGKCIEIDFGFKAFSQFSREGFKFLLVHNLPVSVTGVNISKTGRYTILITVSGSGKYLRFQI